MVRVRESAKGVQRKLSQEKLHGGREVAFELLLSSQQP